MQWQFSSRSWFKRNSIWLIIRGLQISQRLQIFTPPWSNRMLHEVHTQRNRLKFHPSQKQCSCVHNPHFETVRKHCVRKQKNGCVHKHTHTFNSKLNWNSVSYQIEENMFTVTTMNQNEFHLVSSQKENRHYDHILLNLIIFQWKIWIVYSLVFTFAGLQFYIAARILYTYMKLAFTNKFFCGEIQN